MPEQTRPGRIVGDRYRLVAELGAGSFGRVWTAHDERLDTVVAVKEVHLPSWGSPDERAERLARAEREGRNAVRLRDHPNVVTVHDVVTEDGAPWIVMRLVGGISLKEHLDTAGRLPVPQVAHLAAGLLAALSAAHAAAVVHRDVKPGNVLLSTTGEVLLTDFGIAVHRADSTVTVPGMVVGTLAYTAPERFGGTDDAAGDLFSLGVVLYEAVTGACPFHRDSTTAALHAVLHHEPPPPACPPALSRLVMGLLAKDPAERLTVRAAQDLLTGLATEPVPVGRSGSDAAGRLLPKTKVLPEDTGTPKTGAPKKAKDGSGKGKQSGKPKGGGSAGKSRNAGSGKPKSGGSGKAAGSASGRSAGGGSGKSAGGSKGGAAKPTAKPARSTASGGGSGEAGSAAPATGDTGASTPGGATPSTGTPAAGTSSDSNGWLWLVGLVAVVLIGLYAYNRDARDATTGGCVYTTDHKKLKREPCAFHWPSGTSYRVLERFQPAATSDTCTSVDGWNRITDTSWYWPPTTKEPGVLLCLETLY